MRIDNWVAPLLWGALNALGCTNPAPASDAAGDLDAGVSDRASGWDHNVGHDTQFVPRDAGPGCGDVPSYGSCDDGGTLRWCEDNAVHSFDCAAIQYSCAEKPSLGGFWCLAGPGQSCHNWPCREPLLCGDVWLCSGRPDAGQHESGSEDHASEDGGAIDAAGADRAATG